MDASGGTVFQLPVTEDETIARKRSRRVSFADTTNVRFFERDEDFETPPEERPASPSPSPGKPLAGDAAEGDDTEGEEEFVRPPFGFLGDVDVGSSSPGSAAGSISSFDGDGNFFGVVSTSFIQSGRPSDSGISEDDSHDVTLDSRTFSMHFDNIIPPDDFSAHSAGSLRIVNSESTTPLMDSTGSQSVKSSTGRDALTDMTVCADNSDRYNYTKLSPTLNNLLQEAQEQKSIKGGTNNFVNPDHALSLPASKEQREEITRVDMSFDELGTVSSIEGQISIPVCSSSDPIQEDTAMIADPTRLQEDCNDDHISHPDFNTVKTSMLLSPPPTCGSFMSNIDLQPPVLDQPSKDQSTGANQIASASILSSAVPTFSMSDAEQMHQQNQDMYSETGLLTPRIQNQPLQLIHGSVSSLRSKRQQLFSPIAPSPEACSLGSEFSRHGKRISALNDVLTLRKRRAEEHGCAEEQLHEKRAKGQISPIGAGKQLPCETEENQSAASDSEQSLSDDWKKVVVTVSNSIEQMQICPASMRKLNLQQLDMLGDMLGKIHVARKFKRLSTAVRIQDSRLAEARSLHDKLLYEKAKLEINHVKLDKLRNKAQLCQVGIQECHYLKSKISQLLRPTAGAAQMKGSPLHAETLITASDRQEGQARITEKKLVLGMIQQKVEDLKSSLEHFCNIKGDISEVIRVAKKQLEMRNQCQIINQQASLWELHGIFKRENKRDVILNYSNLLFQRVILNISDMSSIFFNNSLSGTRIEQAYPNLNASVAFNFVFKAEENQSVSDLRSLQKKTMETSLLLGNLIDVLEEIEDAKRELLNLISADFVVDSQTGQLAFSLRFISCKSTKRVAFSIDMTDLTRAVYPSEPCELPIKVIQAETTLSQPSLDKLMVSIRDLQPGRVMILRLCRMVSRLVNSLPG